MLRKSSFPMDLGPICPPLHAGGPSRGERHSPDLCGELYMYVTSLLVCVVQCAFGSESAAVGESQLGPEERCRGRESSISEAEGRGA